MEIQKTQTQPRKTNVLTKAVAGGLTAAVIERAFLLPAEVKNAMQISKLGKDTFVNTMKERVDVCTQLANSMGAKLNPAKDVVEKNISAHFDEIKSVAKSANKKFAMTAATVGMAILAAKSIANLIMAKTQKTQDK